MFNNTTYLFYTHFLKTYSYLTFPQTFKNCPTKSENVCLCVWGGRSEIQGHSYIFS